MKLNTRMQASRAFSEKVVTGFGVPPMRRLSGNATQKSSKEINLIPMINIIFLLLIFFLLTGTVQPKPPGFMQLAETEKADGVKTQPDLLSLDAQGQWWIGSRNGSDEEVKAYLVSRDHFEEGQLLKLYIDKRLKARDLQNALGFLTDHNAGQIQILTKASTGAP
jgi:biopolymer transport protein ExbD